MLSRAQVCEACAASVGAQRVEGLCHRCGDAMGVESARFASAMGLAECTMCRLAAPEFERAVAFAVYDEELREMLHLLKFNGMRGIAEAVLREGMAQAMLTLEAEAARELVVVPVPLFAAKEKKRGFNQATVLAQAGIGMLKTLRPEWSLELRTDVLQRVKDTRAMFALDPSARRRSLQGAFRVGDEDAIAGREVMLVDDIMTTGATARECARVLKRAGAAKVWVVTMARAHGADRMESVTADGMPDVAMWDAAVSLTSRTQIRQTGNG